VTSLAALLFDVGDGCPTMPSRSGKRLPSQDLGKIAHPAKARRQMTAFAPYETFMVAQPGFQIG
jgi:hypothetical protein